MKNDWTLVFLLWLGTFFLLCFCIFGCATFDISGGLNPKTYYRHDLEISVNGIEAVGVLTVPKSKSYEIIVNATSNIDFLLLTSCHRQFTVEKQLGRVFNFDFIPQAPIETTGSCTLRIEAFEKQKFIRYSSALIEFENSDTKLPAVLVCNGKSDQVGGASICQAWNGLEQMIVFSTPVNVATPSSGCATMEKVGDIGFRWVMTAKECVYWFREIGGEKRFHRLQTVGYEEIAVRGD